MLKVGLTGGIGCGKSTAVDAFRVLGVPIIDADKISKDIVKSGGEALTQISNTFGSNAILKSGELNRAFIKEIVFSNPEALEKLEVILHPLIRTEIVNQLSTFENHSNPPIYVIVDIPLLAEKNYQLLFDRIIVVDCLPEQQLERVITRDNMTNESIKKIMLAQAGRDERKKIATDILDNTGDVDTLRTQVKDLHNMFIS